MKNFKLTNKAKKTFMVSATVVLGSLNGCYIYENNNYETNNDNATINQEDKFNISASIYKTFLHSRIYGINILYHVAT